MNERSGILTTLVLNNRVLRDFGFVCRPANNCRRFERIVMPAPDNKGSVILRTSAEIIQFAECNMPEDLNTDRVPKLTQRRELSP